MEAGVEEMCAKLCAMLQRILEVLERIEAQGKKK